MGLDMQIMMYPELAKVSFAMLYGKVSLHAHRFSLKEAAPLSIPLIFVTDDTSHDKTFPLKEVAPKNIRITHTPPRNAFIESIETSNKLDMSATLSTHQDPIGHPQMSLTSVHRVATAFGIPIATILRSFRSAKHLEGGFIGGCECAKY